MKSYDDAAVAEMTAGKPIVTWAMEIYGPKTVRWWGGFGTLLLKTYAFTGIGDSGVFQAMGGTVGAGEENLAGSLSGVAEDVLGKVDMASYRRSPVVVWLLVFDRTGANLLDAHIYKRGRLDQAPYAINNGVAEISAVIEGAARGSNRCNGRVCSDTDQRLIDEEDGGMREISYAGNKTFYWGGTIPEVAGTAVK